MTMKTKFDDLSAWTQVVKAQKVSWMEHCKSQPDMNPTVVVEREGKVRAVVVADQLDKEKGLYIAFMCRRGFAADALTLICDAHVAKAEKSEDMNKWMKPGSMQKACDEQGACKTREITDCLTCTRIHQDKMQYLTLPYFYDEKYANSFHWLDDETIIMDESDSEVKLEGYIPNSLKKIMKEPPLVEMPELMNAAKALGLNLEKEKQLYHSGRAISRFLEEQGHMCVFLEPSPYDPPIALTDAIKRAELVLELQQNEKTQPSQ